MKDWIIILMVILTASLQSCDKIKQENDISIANNRTEIIDPVILSCFELDKGESFFDNPIRLNKNFRGKAYLQASIDTASIRLTNIKVIRADLFTKSDSVPFIKFVDTNFSKEPEYPTRLENIMPHIIKYIETVEVRNCFKTY